MIIRSNGLEVEIESGKFVGFGDERAGDGRFFGWDELSDGERLAAAEFVQRLETATGEVLDWLTGLEGDRFGGEAA
jgi:hypothetical protein